MSLSHLTAATRRLVRSLKPYDIVVVSWEDAYTVVRDATVEQAFDMATNDPYIRNSVGYVVRADNDYVVIASTDDRQASGTSSEVADLTVLCTGFVREVRLLSRDK